jgi:hypothetical protein
VIFDLAGNAEQSFPKPNHRPEGGTSLGLEPEENARRFQDRSFPLPVSPQEKVKARSQLDPKRFEAAKIPQLKFGEHGGVLTRLGEPGYKLRS